MGIVEITVHLTDMFRGNFLAQFLGAESIIHSAFVICDEKKLCTQMWT